MIIRPHPADTLSTMYRYRALWFIPLLRLFPFGRHFSLSWELVLALLLCLYAVWRYRTCRYFLSEDGHLISVLHRLPVCHTVRFFSSHLAFSVIERPPLSGVFGARRIQLVAAARRAKTTLTVSKSRAMSLFSPPLSAVCPSAAEILLFAVSGPESALALLSPVPILRRIAALTGRDLIGTLTDTAALAPLPLVLRTVAALFVAGWLFSVARTFFRSFGFRACREADGTLRLSHGCLTRRDTLILPSRIFSLRLRRTPLLHLTGKTAVWLGTGTGKPMLLLPAVSRRHLRNALSSLSLFFFVPITLRPTRASLLFRLAVPLCLAIGCSVLVWLSPFYTLSLLGTVAFLLAALIALLAHREAGVGVGTNGITLCYPRAFSLHRVFVPFSAVERISVTTSPFFRRTVTLCVYEAGTRRPHRVRGLRLR